MNESAIEKLRKIRQKIAAVPISKDVAMAQILQNSSIVRKNPYYRGVKKTKTSTPLTLFLSEQREMSSTSEEVMSTTSTLTND